jgi:RimJ/RimL family protein N-acetyltransferase
MRFKTDVGFFEVNSFPCCSQIAILNHSFIEKEYRGVGLGTELHKERLNLVTDLGYDYTMCTVKSTNIPQIKILQKAGWKQLDQFFNRETESLILIFGKQLR